MLKRFKDNWAISDFVKLELKRTVQQSRRSRKKLSKVCIYTLSSTNVQRQEHDGYLKPQTRDYTHPFVCLWVCKISHLLLYFQVIAMSVGLT